MTAVLAKRLFCHFSAVIVYFALGYFNLAQAVVRIPEPGGVVYGVEDIDWKVEATSNPFPGPYNSKTPSSIPGGRVILTRSLMTLLKQYPDLLIIDVLGSNERHTIPGAFWLPGAGVANLSPEMHGRFINALASLTNNDKSRPLVFVCLGAECWVSYNAALRAIAAGYTDVIWYRGGSESWRLAGNRLAAPIRLSW